MKKVIAIVLTVCLLFAAVPLSAFNAIAEGAAQTTGDCTWEFNDNVLTISGNGEMADYDGWSETAPWSELAILEVVIGDGVTHIGSFAFYDCQILSNITVAQTVNSVGEYAFSGCMGLGTIYLPNTVESIGEGAFSGCESLTGIEIPNGLKVIEDGVFSNCINIKSIDIPYGITQIGMFAFEYCTQLESITIPESVTDIGYGAFDYCLSLKSIDIPKSVTFIDSLFYNCQSLEKFEISENVEYIAGDAFARCASLKEFIVDENNKVYSANKGVLFNKDQTTLVLYPIGKKESSYSVPYTVTRIGINAFRYSQNLTSINIPVTVTSVGADAFSQTAWYYNKPEGPVYAGKVFYAYKGACPKKYEIKNGTLGIADSAFSFCDTLEEITIPESVVHIGEYAFFCCTTLGRVILPDGIKSISDGEFSYCMNLRSVTIPKSVEKIGYMAFEVCPDDMTVYYNGTAADKKKIQIDPSFNDVLFNEKNWKYLSDNTVSGKITSFGKATDKTKIEVFTADGKTKIYEFTVTEQKPDYSFGVAANSGYILKVSKTNHATREMILNVGNQNILNDVKLLLKGDYNADGSADKKDLKSMMSYINNGKVFEEYDKAVMDLNNDNSVDKKDLNLLKKHINNVTLLW